MEPSSLARGLFALGPPTGAECLYFGGGGFVGRHRGYGAWIWRAVRIADTALEIFHPGRGWQTEEPGKGRTRIEAWILGIEHFLECIFNGSEPINSAEHARHVLDIMLTAGRSAREGQTIELQTDFQHSSGPGKIKRQDD